MRIDNKKVIIGFSFILILILLCQVFLSDTLETTDKHKRVKSDIEQLVVEGERYNKQLGILNEFIKSNVDIDYNNKYEIASLISGIEGLAVQQILGQSYDGNTSVEITNTTDIEDVKSFNEAINRMTFILRYNKLTSVMPLIDEIGLNYSSVYVVPSSKNISIIVDFQGGITND